MIFNLFNKSPLKNNNISERIIRKRISEMNAKSTGILISEIKIEPKSIKYRISLENSNNSILKEIKKFKTNEEVLFLIKKEIIKERIMKASKAVFSTMVKTGEKKFEEEVYYWRIEHISIKFYEKSCSILATYSRFNNPVEITKIKDIFDIGFTNNTADDIKIFTEKSKLTSENLTRKFINQLKTENKKIKEMSELKEDKPKEEQEENKAKKEKNEDKVLKPKVLNNFNNENKKVNKKGFFSFLFNKKEKKVSKDIIKKKNDEVTNEEIEKDFEEIMALYPKELDRISAESEKK
jgi:hypothetical protein